MRGGVGEGGVPDVVDGVDAAAVDVDAVAPGQPSFPRHSNRENKGVPPLKFIEMYLASAVEEEVKQSPQTIHEALQGAHGEKWQATMNSEIESLRENGVFEFVDRPVGKKVVKSKWVLRV